MMPDIIKAIRQRLGQSQNTLARNLGVTVATVSQWETGKARPSPRMGKQLEILLERTAALEERQEPFRPIQYLGSKFKLASTIASLVDEVSSPGSRVGDLFSGSGVVSHMLANTRPVTAVDIQRYAEVLAQAILGARSEDLDCMFEEGFWRRFDDIYRQIESIFEPLLQFEQQALAEARKGDAGSLAALIEFGSLAAHVQLPSSSCPHVLARHLEATVERLRASHFSVSDLTASAYFGGPYFAYSQAVAFDALDLVFHSLEDRQRTAMRAVLLSAASEIVNTVGKQFAQPIKIVKANGHVQPLLLQRSCRDRTLDVKEVYLSWGRRWVENLHGEDRGHQVVRSNVIEFVQHNEECQVYYADPPYTIDHYSRFYHVLETLVSRDAPSLDEMKKGGRSQIMRGIYRAGRYQSPFCIPAQARFAYEEMLSAIARRSKPLILSYSPFNDADGHRPRLLTLEELVAIARKYFSSVELVQAEDHCHRKLNARAVNVDPITNAERFIVCGQQ